MLGLTSAQLDSILEMASSFAEEALFYDKNDGNTLLLIKGIQEEKRKKHPQGYPIPPRLPKS